MSYYRVISPQVVNVWSKNDLSPEDDYLSSELTLKEGQFICGVEMNTNRVKVILNADLDEFYINLTDVKRVGRNEIGEPGEVLGIENDNS